MLSVEAFDGLGFRPDAARGVFLLGQALLRGGHRTAAADALVDARDRFASMGADVWEQRALEELERSAPGRGSGELTPTERQIAGLVAEGMQNRQIAQAMFVSVATVEAHLTRIYRKLQIRSRAELTRLVIERGLLEGEETRGIPLAAVTLGRRPCSGGRHPGVRQARRRHRPAFGEVEAPPRAARLDTVLFLMSAMVVVDTIGAIAIGRAQAFTWLVVLFVTFFIPSALASAELGAALPDEGGAYVWVRTAFGRFAGAVTSLLYWAGTPMWLGGSVTVVAITVFERSFAPLDVVGSTRSAPCSSRWRRSPR